MDEDLKAYLQGMEDRTAALIAAEVGNLHTEMQQGFAHVDTRLDSIDSRLKLQAGLIQSGARAMARFSEFAENSEERWVALVGRVEALERKIEGGPGKG
jgi:uncharacterized protein (DUF885 family)